MQSVNKDAISPVLAVTLHGLFLERCRRSPNKETCRNFDNVGNEWVSFTWGQMREKVVRMIGQQIDDLYKGR